MTIKEIEQELEVPRATVRYYEKEGLITPGRKGNSYREYSDDDIAALKKIIILRKLGFSLSDIKNFLQKDVDFQAVLQSNILLLEEKMKELQGAIKVCKYMQEKNETCESFDEDFYWDEINKEEEKGNRFLDLLNDVIDLEKKAFLKQFDLLDNEGNRRYSIAKSLLIVLITCVICGGLNQWLDENFIEGFMFPLISAIVYSIYVVPLGLLKKKYKDDIPKVIFVLTCLAATVIWVSLFFVCYMCFN